MSTIRSNFIGPLTGTSLPTLSASPVLMDAKAYNWNSLTTNTYLDFDSTVSSTLSGVSGIPTWAKRITVMFNGLSTSATSIVQVQLGSGSVQTTGYNGNAGANSAGGYYSNFTSGFPLSGATPATAANLLTGSVVFSLLGSNIWTATGSAFSSTYAIPALISGAVTLSGTLDRVRITTVNGTDTFDAGSVSVMYE